MEDPWALVIMRPFLEACIADIRRARAEAASWIRLRDMQRSKGSLAAKDPSGRSEVQMLVPE